MKTKNKRWFSGHSHAWIVIIVATILAIVSINLLPNEKIFPTVLAGIVISHGLILLIALFSGWMLLPERTIRKWKKTAPANEFDFGWSSKWTNGFGFASFLVLALDVYLYFVLAGSPVLRIVLFTVLLLLAVNFFIGNIIAKASRRESSLVLPFVDLFRAGKAKVLDAGCGAGRTTISLAKTSPEVNIVAFDRFDAAYIDDGGKGLLQHNIDLAGISSRVTITQGDITGTPFESDSFDAAASAYMFDHLGGNKLVALNEMRRILKPGGRFLLVIMVRGYSMFAISSVLSLIFPGRKDWRKLFQQSGLRLVDEGDMNFGAYFLVEKPAGSQS